MEHQWSKERLMANIEAIDAKIMVDINNWEKTAFNAKSEREDDYYISFVNLVKRRYYWSKLLRAWYGVSVLSDWMIPSPDKEVKKNGADGA